MKRFPGYNRTPNPHKNSQRYVTDLLISFRCLFSLIGENMGRRKAKVRGFFPLLCFFSAIVFVVSGCVGGADESIDSPFKVLDDGLHFKVVTHMEYFLRIKNPKFQDAILKDFDRCALGWETSMTYFYYQGYKPEEPWVGQFDAQVDFAKEKGISALRKAHSLDPGAELFINEGLYWSPWPSVAKERGQLFFELVSDLVKRGVPLDGIGEQMHLQTRYTNPSGEIDLSLYEPYLKRFTDLGLDVHITELDVAIRGEVNEESLKKQAEIYTWAMDLVMRNKGITKIALFSLTDVVSYQHNFDSALSGEALLNIDNVPKPAYYAMKRRLSQR
jgi:hypothetical protein